MHPVFSHGCFSQSKSRSHWLVYFSQSPDLCLKMQEWSISWCCKSVARQSGKALRSNVLYCRCCWRRRSSLWLSIVKHLYSDKMSSLTSIIVDSERHSWCVFAMLWGVSFYYITSFLFLLSVKVQSSVRLPTHFLVFVGFEKVLILVDISIHMSKSMPGV